MRSRAAFTLVELLVVIAIIGLLSTVAVVALGSARENARNARRKTDLTQISKALELYYNEFGAYPSTGAINAWRGSCANYQSRPDVDTLNASPTSCNDIATPSWIPGLTSCGYMPRLPRDLNSGSVNQSSATAFCRTGAAENCFIYTSTGIHYKLLAHCTPEGTMLATDPYYDPKRPINAWRVTDDPSVTDAW